MELDDLKAKWQQETAKYSDLNKKDNDQLKQLLNSKTLDLIVSMKRKYEKIISVMLGSMLLMVLALSILTDGFTYPGSGGSFAICIGFYLVLILFYWVKFKSVSNIQLSDHLQERLEQLLKLLKNARTIEITFVLLFSVLFIAVVFIGRAFLGKGLESLNYSGLAIGVLFIDVMIYLIINRFSGQINELEGYLEEYEKEV